MLEMVNASCRMKWVHTDWQSEKTTSAMINWIGKTKQICSFRCTKAALPCLGNLPHVLLWKERSYHCWMFDSCRIHHDSECLEYFDLCILLSFVVREIAQVHFMFILHSFKKSCWNLNIRLLTSPSSTWVVIHFHLLPKSCQSPSLETFRVPSTSCCLNLTSWSMISWMRKRQRAWWRKHLGLCCKEVLHKHDKNDPFVFVINQ